MDLHEDAVMVSKGKRTKRQRTASSSSFVLTMATSSCSSAAAGAFLDYSDHRFTASPSDSGDLAQSSIEEEDMANCLILLARGSAGASQKMAAEVYQCKTCNRCFPSFQALGGHRASHKKPPKAASNLEERRHEIKSSAINRVINYGDHNTALSLQIPGRESGVIIGPGTTKSRVHECSICGAEFSSGQALGGHMRRHRPLPTAAASSSSTNYEDSSRKERTILSLDLNLDPAPEPEEEEEYAVFTSKQETIVFTASPLVDCHY